MKEVISVKYGWNTMAWGKTMDQEHKIKNLLGVKIHTSCKISNFC